MAFELKNVVPWGRNLDEYKSMFNLTDAELNKKIISFGDGPASFNYSMFKFNKSVISIDPIYGFSVDELKRKIKETKDIVINQTRNNAENFVWTKIKNIQELETIRLSAMNLFLQDFESGKREGRYINHEMPDKTNFADSTFDLGLSSHFLILYAQLGLDFHLSAMTEMLRVAKEIRIFPILDLDAHKPALLAHLVEHFGKNFKVEIQRVDYEFQKNGNEMLRIKRK
ncbi:SAM-dependent methyltransferase [Cyclobacterium plantarum]|uniref:SAM-dependent methyltransferase n=1 Tax=Cyclobacterium plantarum TaxID=2716263 RepID=A0ABX0H6B3_9BACT|nr:SAM-dependent methyltransferase [Cyclobacterium plantarum]NHE55777.1 SAM-dependent methyltransferase [Cyclobacterium plantarum]